MTVADPTREQRWERATSGPALLLAIVYLIAWSVLVLYEDLNRVWWLVLLTLMILIWGIFVVDYIIKIVLSPQRLRYVLLHPLDLLAVILPFMRPVVQLTHINSIPFFQRRAGATQRLRLLILAGGFVIVFVYSIALAVYNVERTAPDANITSFGASLWWACVTLFTVGYGDVYPVTIAGRVFAVLLMLGGFAIIGVSGAVVGSYLTERVKAQADAAKVDAANGIEVGAEGDAGE